MPVSKAAISSKRRNTGKSRRKPSSRKSSPRKRASLVRGDMLRNPSLTFARAAQKRKVDARMLAVSALGLLPDLGLGLHADRSNRDSLVFDVCEPVRPALESWLIRWVSTEPLHRRDFFEVATGNVRLRSNLCAKLSETAPTCFAVKRDCPFWPATGILHAISPRVHPFSFRLS